MVDPGSAGRRSLTRAWVPVMSVVLVVLIGVGAMLVDRSLRAAITSDLVADLETVARTAAIGRPTSAADAEIWVDESAAATGFRFTLIDDEGLVLADSHTDPAVMENHSSRPEVVQAKTGVVGHDTRLSLSTGYEQVYVALPPEDGMIVRTSAPTREIEEHLGPARFSLVIGTLVVTAVGIGALILTMRRMAAPIGELASTAEAMAAGDLAARPPRSRYQELDRLSLAISTLASDLDKRGSDVEQASGTLEVVLGAIPQGTILFEGDDRIIYSNTAARQILGVLPEALGGFTPLQLQMSVREARESGNQVVKVVEHGKPVRILRGTATPFSEDDRVLLVIVDITERERTDAVRRDFVANASHELKTPVATIIASAEALQISLSRGDSSAEKFAATIESSARQLDRLVTDLLDLSRLEKETPDLVPVRLDLLVKDEVERVRERAVSQGIRLDSECEQTTVMGSHRDLAIAVRNLLDNAIRHTPMGGSVDVSLARDGESAVLRVTDTGEGIPTRDLQRVFERFYRVDSARSRGTGGTGLGLSIVRHVVEAHGGSVWAESELARGSVFTVSLPIVVDGAASADN